MIFPLDTRNVVVAARCLWLLSMVWVILCSCSRECIENLFAKAAIGPFDENGPFPGWDIADGEPLRQALDGNGLSRELRPRVPAE